MYSINFVCFIYIICLQICKNKIFNKDNMKGSCPKIPQQNNFTDCGLYLLQYVEQFFKVWCLFTFVTIIFFVIYIIKLLTSAFYFQDPILDYSLPIKQLTNWFDEIVVTRKREEISNLLKTLMHKYNPDSHLNLPDITFPTLNGSFLRFAPFMITLIKKLWL